MEDTDLNKNQRNSGSNRTLWVTWRRIRDSRGPVLAHLEHFLAANIVLERARTAACASEWAKTWTGVQALPHGVQHTPGCQKSITAARLETQTTVTGKDKPDCLQLSTEPQYQEMDFCDLSQWWVCNGGRIPMV